MPYSIFVRTVVGAIFVLCLPHAQAQEQRFTYVSQFGGDANTCFAPTSPCIGLQRAHDRTLAGGTIFVLDSGGSSQALTITKSISIVAVGATRYIVAINDSPITVNAGPDDVVLLDGLRLKGLPNPTDAYGGIHMVGTGRLHVQNCVVEGFGRGAGIDIRGVGSKRVVISDCTITNNRHGILARGNGNVSVVLDRVTVDGNANDGVRSDGSGKRVRISSSTIINNGVGINALNGGALISHGNNVIRDNGANGAPTETQPLQ